jgi:hypothetical protein
MLFSRTPGQRLAAAPGSGGRLYGPQGAPELRFVHMASLEVLVTTRPDAGAAAGRGHLRAAHVDREHVIDLLKAAFVAGRLTKDELDTRAGQALTARTYAELAAVTADLPAEPPAARPRHQPTRRRTEPAPTPGARNAALASVGCLAAAVLALVNAIHFDDSNSRTFLSMALVMLVLTFILAVGAVVEAGRSRKQPPPGPGQGGPDSEQRRSGASRDPSLPAPRPDEPRADEPRADEHRSDLRSRRAGQGSLHGCGVRAPLAARPAPVAT